MREQPSARQASPALFGQRWPLPALCGIAVLLAGVWAFTPAATSGEQPLSPAAQATRDAVFLRAGPPQLPAVLPQERRQALAAMQLPAEQQQQLERQRPELVWFTVWDDRDEDGDIVSVEAAGFSQSVRLTHDAQRIALPKPLAEGIILRGIHDGGGGITVAIAGEDGPIPVPVMTVGQAITLPAGS